MKVALVYDRVNKWGGAERVLLALHELFPDAPLYTSVYDSEKATWAKDFDIRTSFLQKVPFAKKHHELFALFMPIAFERFKFDEYDLIISVTSEAAKGIKTNSKTKHICYCLTPTRYLWSGYDDYFRGFAKILLHPLVMYLRNWDKKASKRPDLYIAISEEVQKRIKKYYDRESELIYPPVMLENQKSEIRNPKLIKNTKNKKYGNEYYLLVSRLSKFTKYKRIDLAIDACNKLKLPLKIVGDGNMRKDLEKLAGPTIEFAGSINDKELIKYYKNCKALIFPGLEDLGLVMIEAQLFGKPVIALNKGGAKELVINGKTGFLFKNQNTEDLVNALKSFEKMEFNSKDCIENARKFNKLSFKRKFMFVVRKQI
jgi:glycosyltransferase involved in cell wall biosynthesis